MSLAENGDFVTRPIREKQLIMQGQDGAPLVPQSIISFELQQASKLGIYLSLRTTRILFERVDVLTSLTPNGDYHSYYQTVYTSPDTYRTPRRRDVYYDPDRERFIQNVSQSTWVLDNWTEVTNSIQAYSPDIQRILYAAVIQNVLNDFVGLSYAYQATALLKPTDERTREHAEILSQIARTLGVTYYKLLSDNQIPHADLEKIIQTYTSTKTKRMDFIELAATIDYDNNIKLLRTRRETDTGLFTVFAAQQFIDEQRAETTDPSEFIDVITPMLGALDLAYALEALGYPAEKIYAFMVVLKGKDKSLHFQEIPEEIVTALEGKKVAIFEDTYGEGRHMNDLVPRLKKKKIYVTKVRCMFRGKKDNGEWADLDLSDLGITDVQATYNAFVPEQILNRSESMTASLLKIATGKIHEHDERHSRQGRLVSRQWESDPHSIHYQ